MRLRVHAAVLVIVATPAGVGCAFQCVDTFALGQGLTPKGNVGGTMVLESAPGGLWWITGALDAVRIETFGQPETARDVEVVVTTNTSTAIRVPNELEVGTRWSVSAPGPDVDGLIVVGPEDVPEPLDAEDLSAPFVRADTLETRGSYCTSATNPFPPPPVSIADLVFQTALAGDSWRRVLLDVWLLEPGEDPAPDGVVRAVDSQPLLTVPWYFPPFFDDDDNTLHISPAATPNWGGAVAVRLRDPTTALTSEPARFEP